VTLPPPVASGLVAAFDIIRDEPERRRSLLRRAALVRDELKRVGFDTLDSQTQIIPVRFGDECKAKQAMHMLWDHGAWVWDPTTRADYGGSGESKRTHNGLQP
jgi:7-keto-8-aminopelargonate synthetase-like enzyme